MLLSHRIAVRDDLHEIVSIYNATVSSGIATADTEPVTVESRIPWFDLHTPDSRPLWVAQKASSIVGWLSFSSFYGRPAYAKTAELSIYIRDEFRRQGVGAYLLQRALTHAPTIGVDTLLGFIFGHNDASLTLFSRFGFVRWAELPGVAMLKGKERDLVIVGRKVAASPETVNTIIAK